MGIGDLYKTADWKAEKHVPVIDCPGEVKADDLFKMTVTIGKEISHPNTTDHHIRWVTAYFLPEGSKFAYEIGRFEFNAHGESVEGPDTGPAYTHHEVTTTLMLKKSGTILASSLCNIHGLWESSFDIKVA